MGAQLAGKKFWKYKEKENERCPLRLSEHPILHFSILPHNAPENKYSNQVLCVLPEKLDILVDPSYLIPP